MNPVSDAERIETVVVGGGQAGLYRLPPRPARSQLRHPRRQRADRRLLAEAVGLAPALHPARFNGLDGMPFPGPGYSFSTKDEVADYLETYAALFRLPVRTGVRVKHLSRNGARFLVDAEP